MMKGEQDIIKKYSPAFGSRAINSSHKNQNSGMKRTFDYKCSGFRGCD
jgi:hypothetical protein